MWAWVGWGSGLTWLRLCPPRRLTGGEFEGAEGVCEGAADTVAPGVWAGVGRYYVRDLWGGLLGSQVRAEIAVQKGACRIIFWGVVERPIHSRRVEMDTGEGCRCW